MNAGPSRGGAARPENLVTARSKAPQKKCTGLHLPTKSQREPSNTRATLERIVQQRFASTGSYEEGVSWVPSRNGTGSSTATGQIFTGSPSAVSVDISSA